MAKKPASKKDYENLLNFINSFTIDIVKDNKLNNNLFNLEYINDACIIDIKELNIDFLNQYLNLELNNDLFNINYNKYKADIISALSIRADKALKLWVPSPSGRGWMQDKIASRNKNLEEALINQSQKLKKEEAERAILLKKIKEEAGAWDPVSFLEKTFNYDENHNERFINYDVNTNIYNVSTEVLTVIIDNILLSINHKSILKMLLNIAFTARDLSRGGRKFQSYNFGKLALYYNILKSNDLQ